MDVESCPKIKSGCQVLQSINSVEYVMKTPVLPMLLFLCVCFLAWHEVLPRRDLWTGACCPGSWQSRRSNFFSQPKPLRQRHRHLYLQRCHSSQIYTWGGCGPGEGLFKLIFSNNHWLQLAEDFQENPINIYLTNSQIVDPVDWICCRPFSFFMNDFTPGGGNENCMAAGRLTGNQSDLKCIYFFCS